MSTVTRLALLAQTRGWGWDCRLLGSLLASVLSPRLTLRGGLVSLQRFLSYASYPGF